MKMKKIFLLILFTIFFSSCAEELVTVIDEYNMPYEIKAIPGDNKVSIEFWSGILASDFAGFNLYAKTSENMIQPDDAIKDSAQILPTIKGTNHARTNFIIEIPNYTFVNNTKYFITVTAYGTNELIEEKYIETKINTVVPVIPRPEGSATITANNIDVTGAGTVATRNGNMINAAGAWKVQYFGYQTNFNSVVVVTNMNAFDSDAPYLVNGLYIFYDGTALVKVLIGANDSYQWAYQNNAASWNGV